MKKIIGLSYYYRVELEGFAKIVNKLKESGDNIFFILAKDIASYASKENIRYEILKEGSYKDTIINNLRSIFLRLSDNIENLPMHRGIHLSFIFENWPKKTHFFDKFNSALCYFDYLKEVLPAEKPDIVILPSNWRLLAHLTLNLTRKLNIKTFIIPDYFQQLSPFFGQTLSYFGKDTDELRWIVNGKAVGQVLEEQRCPAKNISHLLFPKFQAAKKLVVNRWLDLLLNEKKLSGYIILALQGQAESTVIIEELLKLMPLFKDKLLIIRPHPLTKLNLSLRLRLRIALMKNVIISRQSEFNDIVENCDLLLTGTSVTTFEATLRNRNTIIVNFGSDFYPFIFVKEKIAEEVKNPSELKEKMQEILYSNDQREKNSERRKEFLKDHTPTKENSIADILTT